MKKAIFIDKDGTLIEDVPYNVDPSRIVLMPGAERAFSLLRRAGFELVLVSNQPGVGLGFFTEKALRSVEHRLQELLAPEGAALSAFYWCPHSPEAECRCRKPEPGLLFKAAREMNLDLQGSWMVGDILNDIEAGHRAGCRSVLIENGNETEWKFSARRFPEYMAVNLEDAAREILRLEELKGSIFQIRSRNWGTTCA